MSENNIIYTGINGPFALELNQGLQRAFVDSSIETDARFRPRIVANDSTQAQSLLATIKSMLKDCTSFDFSVAFITSGGITSLLGALQDLRQRGIPGRILTTSYNNFNEPMALRKLLEFPSIEVRVFQGDFHTKGYLFHQPDYSTIIIGSANLTQKALQVNQEWNILFHSLSEGELLKSTCSEFDKLWNHNLTAPLSNQWIDAYEAYRTRENLPPVEYKPSFVAPSSRKSSTEARLASNIDYALRGIDDTPAGTNNDDLVKRPAPSSTWKPLGSSPEQPAQSSPIESDGSAPNEQTRAITHAPVPLVTPNKMQAGALAQLAQIHEAGEPRALLISATGTGKTYLAAFEIQQAQPRRVLFIAHRERILEASLQSFFTVLGDNYHYQMYAPGVRIADGTCTFAMVETLRRHLTELERDAFDYIIIDEAHHVGAQGYRVIMDYFTPQFYLGMTATPDRTDGYDIFALFNHTIAYRISLQDAMESELLAPFHYFGIADLAIDDETVDDPTLFSQLTSEERVKHVIAKIEEYTIDKNHRRGLIFCSRNEEACTLSELFNQRGYKTIALSGEDSATVRNAGIARLEQGDIQYIFTVNIFNEGIDIPSVNQVIMLRRTESAIVFIQQLGRGLRKTASKEFTLVLDFIGNYQKNFFVPIALSGDRTYNKDNLRRFVKEGSALIPGCSTITFDRISEARVLRAIDSGKFSETRLIKEEYGKLKQELGRIPNLLDFDANQAIDPLIIITKYGSYHAFLKQCEKGYGVTFTESQENILKFVSQKLGTGKRMEDLFLLQRLLQQEVIPVPQFVRAVAQAKGTEPTTETLNSIFNVLTGAFSSVSNMKLIDRQDGCYVIAPQLAEALADEEFSHQFSEVLAFGLSRFRASYAKPYKDTNFSLYAKYTYEDVCKLLNWSTNVNAQNIGGYKYDEKTNTYPVFINYEKAPDVSDTIRYEDRFISDNHLLAISKGKRSLISPEIKRLKAWPGNGMRTYLFVRKNKNDGDGGKEFYFLGEMFPTGEFHQIQMPGDGHAAVEIHYELETPVRADLFDYLTCRLEEEE